MNWEAAQARREYGAKGRHAFLPSGFFERVLRGIGPDLLIATSAPRSERASQMAAKRCGIPSVCVVDLFAGAEIEWLKEPGFGTRVCVLSDGVRKRLIDHGRDPKDIVVTGNPAFDKLFDEKVKRQAFARRSALGWDEKFVIAWASQVEHSVHPFTGRRGRPETPSLIERELIGIVRANKRLALWIRRHPSEIRPLPQESERIRVSDTDEEVELMLHGSDAIATISSTVGLQGAVIGKPIISMEFSSIASGAPYREMGLSLGVAQLTDLEPSILALEQGDWHAPSRMRHNGAAAKLVMDVGEAIASKRTNAS